MKKILITGANGFLGSYITHLLVKQYEVVIIKKDDNLSRLEDIRNQLHIYTSGRITRKTYLINIKSKRLFILQQTMDMMGMSRRLLNQT